MDALAYTPASSDTMTQPEPIAFSPSTVAAHRQRVIARAGALLAAEREIPFVEQFDALPQLSALLASALDGLKSAEDEVALHAKAFEERRAAAERTAHHYEQLFEHAPVALFVTDLYGAIQEVNRAAVRLMKRDATHLDRKSIAAFMSPSERKLFRDRLERLAIAESVDDWRFVLQRAADLPIEVTAAVRLVPGIGHTGKGVLQWLVRPVGESARN